MCVSLKEQYSPRSKIVSSGHAKVHIIKMIYQRPCLNGKKAAAAALKIWPLIPFLQLAYQEMDFLMTI